MAVKSILVHVTNSDQGRRRAEAAFALAVAHDAHVNGLGISPEVSLPSIAGTRIPDSVLRDVEARQRAEQDETRKQFEAAADRAGLSGRIGWLEGRGIPSEVAGLHARYADLTIIGQQPPSGPDIVEESFADRMVLRSGRPVVVFPHVGAPNPPGRRILIAWNASREAARAVGDAMPLLERSDQVTVLSVNPEGIGDLPGADIARHLARHDIRADVQHSTASQIDAGDVLLNHVADHGIDLVVMGAYGHSRLREMVLGGVTRHLLAHMTVPVLMSH